MYRFKHMAREWFLVILKDTYRESCMSMVFYSIVLLTSALRVSPMEFSQGVLV